MPKPHEEDMGTTVVFGDMHQASKEKPELSTLAKAGIAAVLLTSGVGAGAAIPLALSAMQDRPAQATTETIERDYQVGEIVVE